MLCLCRDSIFSVFRLIISLFLSRVLMFVLVHLLAVVPVLSFLVMIICFPSFLMNEFSVENLLFLREVDKFQLKWASKTVPINQQQPSSSSVSGSSSSSSPLSSSDVSITIASSSSSSSASSSSSSSSSSPRPNIPGVAVDVEHVADFVSEFEHIITTFVNNDCPMQVCPGCLMRGWKTRNHRMRRETEGEEKEYSRELGENSGTM